MSLREFAKDELTRAGLFDEGSDYGGMLGEAVMKMIDVFADEGHSGMSAGMAVSIFERIARFEPLTPLTGDDDEWGGPYDYDGTRQNKRCPHVFKDADGSAYDGEGRILRYPDGTCTVGYLSRVPITFPYTPKREYVEVDDSGQPIPTPPA